MADRKMKKLSSGDFGEVVDWEKVKELNGNARDHRTVIVETEDGPENRECLTLETETGEIFTVWYSRGLAPLFKLPDNIYVEIKNLGMKELKSGYLMRLFDIQADEGQLKIPF